jgi:hypothetical protein
VTVGTDIFIDILEIRKKISRINFLKLHAPVLTYYRKMTTKLRFNIFKFS